MLNSALKAGRIRFERRYDTLKVYSIALAVEQGVD